MILQRREFANYLRKNSGVKGDATSSEIQGACSSKLEQCEWLIDPKMAPDSDDRRTESLYVEGMKREGELLHRI